MSEKTSLPNLRAICADHTVQRACDLLESGALQKRECAALMLQIFSIAAPPVPDGLMRRNSCAWAQLRVKMALGNVQRVEAFLTGRKIGKQSLTAARAIPQPKKWK